MGSAGGGWASPRCAPGAALGVPEVALEAVGLVGVVGEHPAEEDVGTPLAGILQQALAQVHIVSAHVLGDASLPAATLLRKKTPPLRGGTVRRHVRLGQTDRRLDARRGRQARKKGRLRRITFARFLYRGFRADLI